MVVSAHSEPSGESNGVFSFANYFRLEIYDVKTHMLLWAFDTTPYAQLSDNHSLNNAATTFVSYLKAIAGGSIPVLTPEPKTRFSQEGKK
jgi:hypothetical protein